MGKRGPKPKPGKRQKDGRLSRNPKDIMERQKETFDKEQRETMSVGIEARMRQHGITESEAKDPLAGSVVGRLYGSRTLSFDQYQAAINYLKSVESNRRAVEAPPPPGAVDLNRVQGLSRGDDDDWTVWATKSIQRYEAARVAIQDAQNQLRGRGHLLGALEVMVIRDKYVPHLEGDLRIALNALSRHYGLQRIVAA